MNILGILKGRTGFGKPIRSGGAAIVRVAVGEAPYAVAVAEERIKRVKYAGGFECAAEAVLEAAGLSVRDLDCVAVSSCCEHRAEAVRGVAFPCPDVEPMGHHDSHATLAFLGSGFDRALVIVADGGGDVLTAHHDGKWWEHPREQLSYYVADKAGGLELIGRDFDEPFAVGFGELYRAATYFLGWGGSRHASKVMALAAYGTPRPEWPRVYEVSDTSLTCPVRNTPSDPIGMMLALATSLGVDIGEPRHPEAEILEIHKDVAAYIQQELQTTLTQRAKRLLAALRVDGVCFGGGVALNVVANDYLARAVQRPVYVAPAPGDDGQALGNAMHMAWRCRSARLPALRDSRSAWLGPPRRIDSAAVTRALFETDHTSYVVFEHSTLAPIVAGCLARGSPVCTFQERSEYGPRALGSRSILGDPTRPDSRALFNNLKGREWFMPFAPTVFVADEEAARTWFGRCVDSPFMSFAVPIADKELASQVRAVTSHDGTARVQTLAPADSDTLIGEVVQEFWKLTGIPMVLNTSFNRGGHPIVETVRDAIESFAKLSINLMVIGRFLVAKSLSPELVDAKVMPSSFPLEGYVVKCGETKALGLQRMRSRECIRAVQKATGAVVFVRSELPLYGPYLNWLRQGRKVTTIRFRKRGVEVPSLSELPLFETADYGVHDRSTPTALVRIERFRYQVFGELTEEHAVQDGFGSLKHMRDDLTKIYPALEDSDWVTIYDIGLIRELSDRAAPGPRGSARPASPSAV